MKTLKALKEQKAKLLRDMQAVIDKTSEEKDGKTVTRALSTEEQTEFDTLQTQISDVNATIERIKALEDAETEGGEGGDGGEGEGDGATRTRSTSDTKKREAEAAQRALDDERDFTAYIRSVVNGTPIPAEARALGLSNNGAIVPKTIANKVIARVYDISPVVEKANRYMTKGTVDVPQYGADSNDSNDDITMAYASEFTALTAKQGAFGSVSLGSFLAGALAKVGNSLINNTDIDVVAKVVELMAQAIARFLEKELLIGTSSKANGLRNLPAAQKMTAAATTAIAADELITLRNKVKGAFRTDGFYVAHQDTLTAIEKLKDSNGQYLFNTNKAEGAWSGTIGGYKAYPSDSMPTMAAGADAIIFVNPAAALSLRMSPDMEIQILKELFATEHATGVVAWVDFDTDCENTQAAAKLTMAAS